MDRRALLIAFLEDLGDLAKKFEADATSFDGVVVFTVPSCNDIGGVAGLNTRFRKCLKLGFVGQ